MKKGLTRRQKRENLAAYILLSPQLVGYLVFVVFPIGFSMYLCFAQWNFISNPEWVGLANFKEVFTDYRFWKSITNTFVYIVAAVPLTLLTSLTLALLSNRKIFGLKIYRAAFFLPMVTSSVAISMVWFFIFEPNGGVLNSVLMILGVSSPPAWLQSTTWAKVAIVIVTCWLKMGYYYIIFDAALKNIPKDLYEAADVEGASFWQKIKSITLPAISPVMFFIIVMLFIDIFNMFNEVYVMTGGGPDYSTYTMSMYIYNQAFSEFNMGTAAVASWVLFFIIGIITIVQTILKRKWVHE